MTDSADHPMLDRIRKLLAKAEGTNNEVEANTFFQKAQELMEKYAISEAEARTAGHGHSQTKPIIIHLEIPKGHVTIVNAHIMLISTIGRTNRCVCYYSRGNNRHWSVAGFEADARFVELLYHSILIQMDRSMLKAFFNTANQEEAVKEHTSFKDATVTTPEAMRALKSATKRTFRPEYIAGYIDRVCQRLYQNYKEREESHTMGMALVLRDSIKDVNDWLANALGIRLTAATSHKQVGNYARNAFARNAGADAANSANLEHSTLSHNKKGLT